MGKAIAHQLLHEPIQQLKRSAEGMISDTEAILQSCLG